MVISVMQSFKIAFRAINQYQVYAISFCANNSASCLVCQSMSSGLVKIADSEFFKSWKDRTLNLNLT